MPTTITLLPFEWTATFTHADPHFSFGNVRDGEYTLQVSCAGFFGGPYPAMPVTVAGADVEVDVILPYPDLPRRDPVIALLGHTGRVRSVAFSADGTEVISAAEDGSLIRWDATSSEQLQTFSHGHMDQDAPLQLSPNGKLLASGAADGNVTIWTTDQADKTFALAELKSPITNLAFAPDGSTLVVSTQDDASKITLWNANNGERLHTLVSSDNEEIPWWSRPIFTFMKDRTSLVIIIASYTGWSMTTWDIASGTVLDVTDLAEEDWARSGTPTSISALPDGSRFAFGLGLVERRGRLVIWDRISGNSASGGYDVSFRQVLFSPDGRFVATSANDNTVVLWDPGTGKAHTVLVSDQGGLNPMAWSPDGTRLAAGDRDGMVLVWETP